MVASAGWPALPRPKATSALETTVDARGDAIDEIFYTRVKGGDLAGA
jgi:hypothetical protein